MSIPGAIVRIFFGWAALVIVLLCPVWIPLVVYAMWMQYSELWWISNILGVMLGAAIDTGVIVSLVKLDDADIRVSVLHPPLKEIQYQLQLTERSSEGERDWR